MKYSLFASQHTQDVIDLFAQVFSDSEGEAEGKLIGYLVADMIESSKPKDLVGFVAKEGEQIVGCIFFSRFWVPSAQTAFILSPVAVATSVQGAGIGQQLISFGIHYLKDQNVELLFTYGDPAYYGKVGFQKITEDMVKAPYTLSQPIGWLAQSLTGTDITPMVGETHCIAALSDPKYW